MQKILIYNPMDNFVETIENNDNFL